MPYLFFLAALSWVAGFFGGLTGTGGIVIPPILIEFFAVDPHLAMAMAQASFIVPSALAVILFARKGQFDWKVALPMAVSGCVCSFLSAAYLKPRLDARILTICFAFCIMLAGAVMLWNTDRVFVQSVTSRKRTVALIALGSGVGVFAGITGSGSNSILVPAMVFMGLEVLSVLGACQLFAVLSSASGTVGNALNVSMDLVEIIWLVAGQIFGVWAGVRLAQRMDTTVLKRYVGGVCFLAGMFILGKAIYTML